MVKGARAMVGVKDAVVLVYLNVPGTIVVPCFTVKVVAGDLRVNESIGTLKVAIITLLRRTPVALFAGSEDTVGGTSVVKVHT